MTTSAVQAPRRATDQEARLAELLDRDAVVDLLHRFTVVLDEQRFDDLRTIFAEDASVTTPGGHADGLEAVLAQAVRNHDPAVRTQHLVTNLVVDVDGDRAHARGNYVGVFATATGDKPIAPAPQFGVGSVYQLDLVRTADGWRVRSMEMHPVWAIGERP